MESEKPHKADFKCSKNTKIQHNLQELEKVTKHYCQPNPAWRQAEEEEFLHNLMMNLPKKKREKTKCGDSANWMVPGILWYTAASTLASQPYT